MPFCATGGGRFGEGRSGDRAFLTDAYLENFCGCGKEVLAAWSDMVDNVG